MESVFNLYLTDKCAIYSALLLCLSAAHLINKSVLLAASRIIFEQWGELYIYTETVDRNLHICVQGTHSYFFVCHRCWLKWNLISWWQCVTTNTSSLLTCPWLLGAPSYRGYKVRVRHHILPVHWIHDAFYHICNHWLALTWPQPLTFQPASTTRLLTWLFGPCIHRSLIKQVASHTYLLLLWNLSNTCWH